MEPKVKCENLSQSYEEFKGLYSQACEYKFCFKLIVINSLVTFNLQVTLLFAFKCSVADQH